MLYLITTKLIKFLKTKLTGLGEFGVRLLSGENITIACSNKRTKPKLIHTGCHENKSEPGFAK